MTMSMMRIREMWMGVCQRLVSMPMTVANRGRYRFVMVVLMMFVVGTAQGTLQSIDHSASTVRIAHEAVPSAKWPAMTMNFKVQSHDVLAGLKEGERVRFSFTEQPRGHYMIVEISPQG